MTEGKEMLLRIVAMLSKMTAIIDKTQEEEGEYLSYN